MTRFAFSPLWEVIASVRVLKNPKENPLHRPWAEWVRPRVGDTDFSLLSDLVPVPTRMIPAFVAPPPRVTAPDLATELAALRSVPPATVRHDLERMSETRTARLEALYDRPRDGLAELADTIEAYWELTMAPHWPRMRTLCEADVMYRSRQLATGGAELLFNDLHSSMSWRGGRLFIDKRYRRGRDTLRGTGLLLTPSVFVPRLFSVTTGDWQATLRYPPRGIATLWARAGESASEAMAAVLGRTRADLLARLSQPASTGELARELGISAGGVSQHLGVLRAAGLVRPHRSGRYVLYARTVRAENLLATR
ncbi:MAG TPA: winged helix-turn-helix domain-containing protein [Stackebrandtia sp.]|uniref:ArsR/SmtB family transcription factor n=1 Tax=Stackebrandtia sp. TaxID=2023065 RepID=UPI002D346562|nr:winged helix-turn-helix domain-containing protein [Stackebrandtia sp.]HZE37346.1 winged helix-turn-helix domain-containing protein [Stackebrandtia sp.]